MNSQLPKSIGIALSLCGALLAALLAVGVFVPPGAGAHNCESDADEHTDFQSSVVACNQSGHQKVHRNFSEPLDGGQDRELVFKAYVPDDTDSFGDADDSIVLTLKDFFIPEALTLTDSVNYPMISIKDSGDDDAVNLTTGVTSDGENLILTGGTHRNGSSTIEAGEFITITIKKGTGILTPEIPRGFDNPAYGYPVTITFVDGGGSQSYIAKDENIVVVGNPISSDVPSADVRIVLVTYAEAEIGSSQEITVDFSGPSADSEFIVPASISNTRVTISYTGSGPGGNLSDSFNPSEILVQRARVTLTIPPQTSTTPARRIPQGEYTITFSQSARIRNPFSAGNRIIKVSSTAPGDVEDRITAVIRRTATISPSDGPRGSEFTLEGRGYAKGTVTVYDGNDETIDSGETLASVKTVRGLFSVRLKARGQPGDPMYTVRTKDSYGADDSVEFTITSSMSLEPSTVSVGSELKITISDWEEDENEEIAAVRIAGQQTNVPEIKIIEYENCLEHIGLEEANDNGTVSLEVIIPSGVPLGEQTVSVYGHTQLEHFDKDDNRISKGRCTGDGDKVDATGNEVTARLKDEPEAIITETIEIVGRSLSLSLSPETVARGQKVTVTGFGFSSVAGGGNPIDSVRVGGVEVVGDYSGMEVGSAGDFALIVTVPLDIAGGSHDVRVEGHDGTLARGTLMIAEATITLDPAEGQRGTEFKVTGRGFIPREVVVLTYGPERAPWRDDIALADAQGNFELTFTVPQAAKVGTSHKVRAVAETAAATVDAEASHLVPGVAITTSPESVSPGDRLTIRAQNLPSFTQVEAIRIGDIQVFRGSGVATDETGSLETDVLVPNLGFGDHILLIQVEEVRVPHIIKVTPPPLSGSPGQVFKYLIQGSTLLTVWRYDNATQSWSLFDPSLPVGMAELNDLTEVSSGDIVWINLSKPQSFQGSNLAEGWNLISLK